MPRLSDLLSEKLKKQLSSTASSGTPRKKDHDAGCRHAHSEHADKKEPTVPAIMIPDFVAVDVETTGLEFAKDRVIEIGAVLFRSGRPAGEFSSFVNPGMPIPPAITELTNIRDADVAGAPPFAGIAPRLLEFIGSLPLCGHQVEFDLNFLKAELDRAGMQPIGRDSLDTALLSKILLQAGRRFSLKSVSDSLDVKLENAHRALHDARASGEVALALIPRLAELPFAVRQTMAAAAPASFLKTLIFKSLGGGAPLVRVRAGREPLLPPKLPVPDKFRSVNSDDIAAVFSAGGALEKQLAGFTPRPSQHAMAVEVSAAFNTQSILIAEAGTGTGKSLAYLIPAGRWAVENNTRVLVATRTRNLQDQLFTKELPLIAPIMGKKFSYSVLKGRSNYICLNRWEQLLRGEAGNLSQRERFAILPLIPWVESTATGDIEEQNQFNPKWFSKVWDLISAESRGCAGRRCPLFKSCFLQKARAAALGSHIVVINHSLFFSELCAGTSFLGSVNSIIFDEAHHLESSGHRHLRVELDTNRLSLFMEEANNLVQFIGDSKQNGALIDRGKEIKSLLKHLRKHATAFLDSVSAWARERKTEAGGEFQLRYGDADFSSSIEVGALENDLVSLKDHLHELRQACASPSLPEKTAEAVREEVAACQERASQLAADLGYLVAAKTEDHAFWAEGNLEKGWSKLCGVPLDIAGLLSGIWSGCCGAVVFTSATLSIARSADYFLSSVGLEPHRARTAVRFFPSPFNKEQSIMGAVSGAPDPDAREFPSFVAGCIGDLHASLRKNILVLFTANAMLAEVYRLLRADGRIDRRNVLAQNISGGRHALLEQFKQNGQMVLLGTDSFWEGIDVPGEACEIVIIPRLPFPVPTHPLVQAISEKMKRLHGESFMSYAVPEAVIRFRQGCGRLIRTATDRGALVVLDKRIVTKGYGRHFIRSLDASFAAYEDKDGMLAALQSFFSANPDDHYIPTTTYVSFDEV